MVNVSLYRSDQTERFPFESLVNFFTIFMTLAIFLVFVFFFSNLFRPPEKKIQHAQFLET